MSFVKTERIYNYKCSTYSVIYWCSWQTEEFLMPNLYQDFLYSYPIIPLSMDSQQSQYYFPCQQYKNWFLTFFLKLFNTLIAQNNGANHLVFVTRKWVLIVRGKIIYIYIYIYVYIQPGLLYLYINIFIYQPLNIIYIFSSFSFNIQYHTILLVR